MNDEYIPFPEMEHSKDKYYGKGKLALEKGKQITELLRKQRLLQKDAFLRSAFPFNMMASCIDEKGDIRK